MSPYAAAKGNSAITVASVASVRSGRRVARASTNSPPPATANRIPADSSGGMSSRPILIATQVLDQIRTRSPYRVQTRGLDTLREARRRGCAPVVRLPRFLVDGCRRTAVADGGLRGVRVPLHRGPGRRDEPDPPVRDQEQGVPRVRWGCRGDGLRAVQAVGITYIGFGSLKVRSALPPSRSLRWSPTLATIR